MVKQIWNPWDFELSSVSLLDTPPVWEFYPSLGLGNEKTCRSCFLCFVCLQICKLASPVSLEEIQNLGPVCKNADVFFLCRIKINITRGEIDGRQATRIYLRGDGKKPTLGIQLPNVSLSRPGP